MDTKKILKKFLSPVVWGNLLAMGVIVTALIIGTMYFLSSYTRHGESIEVPDLRGMKLESALMKLEALELKGMVTDTGYVTSKPPYVLLEQSIAPGKHVKSGRTITFTINGKGARPVAIPDLANNTSAREAEARLRTLGFSYIKFDFIDGDPDWLYAIKVKGVEVNAFQRIPVDEVVTLVVGRGGSIDPSAADEEEEFEDFTEDEEFFIELEDSI